VLLGAALPPGSAWWLIAVGMVAAIVVAKQLYGGLGHNLFNPAMVGYALLLVSFPARMSLWLPPGGLLGPEAASLGHTLASVAGRIPLAELDALSGATPLDAFSHKPDGLMVSEFWASEPLPAGMLSAVQQVSLAWAWAWRHWCCACAGAPCARCFPTTAPCSAACCWARRCRRAAPGG
ncbi:MAG TPA: RnfABCDGE type electron transport complex subunit D, partial [Halomonas sp.]|nr:RnfABCDGE type electron transport complex subunit D [Halomonas sp.]